MAAVEKVAVIGAGALGLMATKQLTEDGFDVTGFEARPYLGGLWKDTDDSSISVHPTTIFNTSKYRAATSDFPFPESAGVYPTAAQIHAYLNAYADHFDLRRKIRVGHRVRHIVRREREEGGESAGGIWEIKVKDVQSGQETTNFFDRVCVATGSFITPRWPKLAGLDKFAGSVHHSIDFHGSAPFKDHNVLVLGIHATAQDVTNALSETAKQVYLSHRHGLTLLPRYNDTGTPFDVALGLPVMLFMIFMERTLPRFWTWVLDRMVGSISRKSFPAIPEHWGLSPAPSMAVSTPLMADTLWTFLESGFAKPVPAVKEITGPKTVILTDGQVLEDIDSIIYCTGYHFNMPEDLIPRAAEGSLAYDPYPNGPGHNPHLYMNIFPMNDDPQIRTSLAFLGHAATNYPGFVQFELQAMAVSQVWKGRSSLPPRPKMLEWFRNHTSWRQMMAKRHHVPEAGHTFYPAMIPQAELIPWLDEMAGTGVFDTFGGWFNGLFNPSTWKLWWQDRELYNLCTKKLLCPAIFRAIDTGKREALGYEAVKEILRSQNASLERSIKAKQEEMALKDQKKKA
ncbi:hypothetical protein PFICI_11648 [Pestalotiopsis fici W106-1]|uniref:Uncharacterized protein n=1 Tax=Pestalotiopsis fici (strain W106-1 / CGMCC3.15140) TaxID=1229662 RepID=W3WTV7_PESFW|nr:uncharacterized protein PFICI_11648 [Pestalotiopsis fici W106-1]ETS76261.1 hypothetical protein PFICI_11648 [Pestalotiopsis fici W106-1]